MITKKTVIVVGAGASNDIGFPLGVDLQKRVSSLLTDQRVELYQHFASAVKHLFDDNAGRAQAAMRRATELGGPLRTAASVDNFLDQHWDEPDFVNVAKLAIAYQIASAEQHCKIRGRVTPIELIDAAGDYFMLPLLNILIRGHQFDSISDSLENLIFVIFNYDRSIERYFLNWLTLQFGDRAKGMLKSSNFIHVYGSLGNYFESKIYNPFEYDGLFAFENVPLELSQYASKIKVFTEQEDSAVAASIDKAIGDSKAIIFLGFGFEEQNMRFFKQSTEKRVFATLFGQSAANSLHIIDTLEKKFSVADRVGNGSGKSKQLFDDYYHPITTAVGSLR